MSAFLRYAAVAVCFGHLSWPQIISHVDVIMQLAETERTKGAPAYAAFVYDVLARKQFARRAEKKDPNLDIGKEIQTVNKELLEQVQQRLESVLTAAGMNNSSSSSGSQANVAAAADSAASKQLAAADAFRKRAEQASKQLAQTQAQIMGKVGFPLVRQLPACEGAANSFEFPASFMTFPRPLEPCDLETKKFTRQFPVREERPKGWRTRLVDHETESGTNPANRPFDKISHDTLNALVTMILLFFQLGVELEQWKRDVSKAFRRVPCCPTFIRRSSVRARPHIITWDDAAGASKWIAAVLWDVGNLWLEMAKANVYLYVARVESKANIADGLATADLSMLESLGAVFVEPVLPDWIQDLWAGPCLN
ncbi:unnamed protein product [Polarella glacialis]|uniref:Uncharacterized protein n=1 Tax=Polarella glacialis TaxID=89957 RepID=A0A813L687_POLGL|nr:unnamed protein product [Polarella glacialis]